MRRTKWSEADAAILRVIRRAKRPLFSREIYDRAGVSRLHFDMRLQALRRRGLIRIASGATSGARWEATKGKRMAEEGNPRLLNWPPSRGPKPKWMADGPSIEVPKITLLTSERPKRAPDSEAEMIADAIKESVKKSAGDARKQYASDEVAIKRISFADIRRQREEQQHWALSLNHHLASIAALNDVRTAERLIFGVTEEGRLEMTLPTRTYRVVLGYPLSIDVVLSIPPLEITPRPRPGRKARPMRQHQTVGYLAWVIAKTYEETIYADWERFGVWGHALSDLWLEKMSIDGEKLQVFIGS